LLTLTVLVGILNLTVFSEEFFRQQIDRSNYSENTMETLQESLSSYGLVSGFDAAFFRKAVPIDTLQAEIYREVGRLYQSDSKKMDTDQFREDLLEKLYKNVEERGLEISEQEKEGIAYLADLSTLAYYNVVSIPFSNQISSLLQRAKDIFSTIFRILLACDLAALIIMLAAGRSRRRKIDLVINSIAGSILLLGAPTLAVLINGSLKNIALSGKAIYYFSQSYISSAMQVIWIYVAIMAIAWICIFFYRLSYVGAKKRKSRH
jgi:hypothetical protein